MNDDSTEKRMAGDYEVIQAVHIGDREVVLGENPQDETGMKYMCAFCRQNALFAEYSEVMASDDFPEIVELFGQRIAEQAQKTHIELNKPRIQGIDDRPITAEGCIPISHEDDLHGKIIVIKPEVLRREYRRATRQLKLCMGGFGASPHSRGSACYCVDLYTGKESRYPDVQAYMATYRKAEAVVEQFNRDLAAWEQQVREKQKPAKKEQAKPPERESVLKRLRQLQAEGKQRNQPRQRKKSFDRDSR